MSGRFKAQVDIHSRRKINSNRTISLFLTSFLYLSVQCALMCVCVFATQLINIDIYSVQCRRKLFVILIVCVCVFACVCLCSTQNRKKNTKVYKLPTQWAQNVGSGRTTNIKRMETNKKTTRIFVIMYR